MLIDPEIEQMGRAYLRARRDMVRYAQLHNEAPTEQERSVAYDRYFEANKTCDELMAEMRKFAWRFHSYSFGALLNELGEAQLVRLFR